MIEHRTLNWPTLLFLILSPIGALTGLVWWIASGHFSIWTVVFTVVFATLTGLGITAGYHRLFSHRSYDAPWPVRLLLLLFGGACFEGSAWDWCIDHRKHHRHSDQEEDPYSIKRGFWHAHMFWLFFRTPSAERERVAIDLWRDPLIRIQHRLYLWLAILVSFLLPMAVASLWGDPWGGLLIGGLCRLVVNQHFTFAINSFCHYFGKQTYSDLQSARDNWVAALFTYGEGYHNFHHEFPSDYRNGIRFFHWDPTKWFIRFLAWLRLAKNLNVVRVEAILMKRLSLGEKRLSRKLADQPRAFAEFATQLMQSTREQVQAAANKLTEVRRNYAALLKQQKLSLEGLKITKSELRQAEKEFRQTVALWESMARKLNKLVKVNARAVPSPAAS